MLAHRPCATLCALWPCAYVEQVRSFVIFGHVLLRHELFIFCVGRINWCTIRVGRAEINLGVALCRPVDDLAASLPRGLCPVCPHRTLASCPRYAERSILGATLVRTLLAVEVDHAFLCMPGAELPLLDSRHCTPNDGRFSCHPGVHILVFLRWTRQKELGFPGSSYAKRRKHGSSRG